MPSLSPIPRLFTPLITSKSINKRRLYKVKRMDIPCFRKKSLKFHIPISMYATDQGRRGKN